ncbi:MAG TPA: hypothetical protein VN976_21860 [Verrucomicrobiae bacterium]|nr:hypothetical protein [Verrucomicrobiae bacterium]
MNDELRYGLLPQTTEDWARLRKFFQGERGFVPPTHLGMASVAETPEGEIAGAVILQMVSYLGPFKIDPRWTGLVDYAKLKEPIDETFRKGLKPHLVIQGYVAITSDERIARIAEVAGMERKRDAVLLVQEFGEHTVIG